MSQLKPEIRNERFSICDPSIYYMYGLIYKNSKFSAVIHDKNVEIDVEPWKEFNALERMDILGSEEIESVVVTARLPKELPDSGEFAVYMEHNGKKTKWFSASVEKIKKDGKKLQYCIDQVKRPKLNSLSISGWAASLEKITIEARDEKGNIISGVENHFPRADVKALYDEVDLDKNCGFMLILENIKAKRVFITIKTASESETISYPMGKAGIIADELKLDAKKSLYCLKEEGFGSFCSKVLRKLKKKDRPIEYSEWIKYNFASKEKLDQQRNTKFKYNPLISIVVPLYKTPKSFLDALIASVKDQSYSNWELVLSDGSGVPSPIGDALKKYASRDKRIKVVEADEQHRIVENTNRAIEHAKGEFIAFADHDDVLAPDALFEVVKSLNEDNELEFIYTDEDKVDGSGNTFFEPQMKPDFNIDLLRTVNYICHLSVIKRELLDKIGYLDASYEGAQDYDLTLRAIENTNKIHHIPRVLYHWRSHVNSTAENPESKLYAFEAGRRAIKAHYDRVGIKAEVMDGEFPGLYRTKYIREYDPLISIIIPNKDHTDDLKRCIDSIEEKSTYKNYEYIIVENNSDKDETFEFYKKLEAENEKVKVVYYKGIFNFSLINNFGAEHASGEYYLLLNNDTSIINPDCFEEMLGYCMRKDVGIVGARLYYEDDTIQHAGVVVGFGGIAGHCFVMHPRGTTGYCHRIICAQDYSAVTAACMMVDSKVFKEVNGLSSDLAVAFNDIDFCLRVREAGYLVVYNPYAELYHFESKSRGLEDTPEKVSRFNSEIDTFGKKWRDFLDKGDPFYNPNLTLDSQDFSLRKNY